MYRTFAHGTIGRLNSYLEQQIILAIQVRSYMLLCCLVLCSRELFICNNGQFQLCTVKHQTLHLHNDRCQILSMLSNWEDHWMTNFTHAHAHMNEICISNVQDSSGVQIKAPYFDQHLQVIHHQCVSLCVNKTRKSQEVVSRLKKLLQNDQSKVL